MNRKKFSSVILAVLLFVMSILPGMEGVTFTRASAASIGTDSNGNQWYYTLASGKATKVYPYSVTVGSSGEITVPSTLNGYTVTSIGAGSSSTVPGYNTASSQYPGLIWSNAGIKILYLPDSVTTIENYCFGYRTTSDYYTDTYYSDTLLTQIYGEGVTTIGSNAFTGCTGLTTAYFPNLVTIGVHAFYGAFADTGSFYIPTTVTSMGSGAFAYSNLKTVEIHATGGTASSFDVRTIYALEDSYYAGLYNEFWDLAISSNYMSSLARYNTFGKSKVQNVVIGSEVKYFAGQAFNNYKAGSSDTQIATNRKFFFLGSSTICLGYNGDVKPSAAPYTLSSSPNVSWAGNKNYKYTTETIVYVPTSTGSSSVEAHLNYTSYDATTVQTYTLEGYKAAGNSIPSAVPAAYNQASSITAKYSGSVTEGLTITPANVTITVNYTNGTTTTVKGNASGVTYNTKTVSSVGSNTIKVTYNGLSCNMTVTGVAKVATGITATLNTTAAATSSGWDSTKQAFEVGTTITTSMFTVVESYNNGTTATLASTAYSISPNVISNLMTNAITITRNGYKVAVLVDGHSQELDEAMLSAGLNYGDYDTIADKLNHYTDLEVALKATIDAARTKLGLTKGAYDSASLTTAIQQLQTRLTNAETSLTATEEEKEQYREALENIQETLGASSDEVTTDTIQSILDSVKETEEALQEATGTTDTLKQMLGLQSDATYDELVEATEELYEDLEEAEEEIEELKDEIVTQKVIAIQNSQNAALYKEQLDSMKTEMAELQAELAQTKTELTQTQYQLTFTQSKLEQSDSKLEDTEATLKAIQETLKETEEQLKASESETNDAKANLKATQDKLAETEKKLQDTTSSGNSTVTELTSKLTTTESELKDTQDALKEAKTKIADLQDKVEDTSDVDALKSELTTATNEISRLSTTKRELETSLESTKKELTSIQTDYVKLEAANTELILKLENSSVKVDNSTALGEVLTGLGLPTDTSVSELIKEYNILEEEVTEKDKELIEKTSKIDSMRSAVATTESELESLKEQLGLSTDATLVDVAVTIEKLKLGEGISVDVIQQAVDDRLTITELRTEVKTLEQKLQDTNKESLEATVTNLEKHNSTLQEENKQLRQDNISMQRKLDELTSDSTISEVTETQKNSVVPVIAVVGSILIVIVLIKRKN